MMTDSELDREHGDALLAQKRTAAKLKEAAAKLDGMLRDWHDATESPSRGKATTLAVNSDGRLIDNRYLPGFRQRSASCRPRPN